VLASNVRSLKTAKHVAPPQPSGVQDALDAAFAAGRTRREERRRRRRAAEGADEVGQSLRAINRQSVDLLESTEAILSLKLQRDTSPNRGLGARQARMLTSASASRRTSSSPPRCQPEAVVL